MKTEQAKKERETSVGRGYYDDFMTYCQTTEQDASVPLLQKWDGQHNNNRIRELCPNDFYALGVKTWYAQFFHNKGRLRIKKGKTVVVMGRVRHLPGGGHADLSDRVAVTTSRLQILRDKAKRIAVGAVNRCRVLGLPKHEVVAVFMEAVQEQWGEERGTE